MQAGPQGRPPAAPGPPAQAAPRQGRRLHAVHEGDGGALIVMAAHAAPFEWTRLPNCMRLMRSTISMYIDDH